MYVLFQVLEQTEFLPQIIEKLATIGVPGVTVLDSIGMGRILLQSSADVLPLDDMDRRALGGNISGVDVVPGYPLSADRETTVSSKTLGG